MGTQIVSEGDMIVASDATGVTQVIDVSTGKVSHIPFSSPLTALEMSNGNVFALFADSQELGCFDTRSKELKKFPLPVGSLVDSKDRIFGIEALSEHKVLLWGPSVVLTGDLSILGNPEGERPTKKRKTLLQKAQSFLGGGDGEGVSTPSPSGTGWKANRGLKVLLGLHRCADGEFLSASQSAQELCKLLPAPFQRKRHG